MLHDDLRQAAPPPRFATLPPRGRLFVAALRAGQADLRGCKRWEDSELLALCDAAGLRRCAAARIGACVVFLLRETEAASGPACAATGLGARLAGLGCPRVTVEEMVLAASVSAPAGPERAARRIIAGWLSGRRRIQGLVLLDLVAQDLAAWRPASGGDARMGDVPGEGMAGRDRPHGEEKRNEGGAPH